MNTDSIGEPGDIPGPERVIPRLEHLFATLASRGGVRHAVLAAADAGGAWTWSDASGAADLEGTPMTPDTPWFLASVTKLFIASVALRLHERGLVDLEAPIGEYLPPSLSSGLHVIDGTDRTDRITVSHLLRHASGLPDSLLERPTGGRSLVEEIQRGDLAFSLAEAVDRSRLLAPHFRPSDLEEYRPRIRYSDTNYQLLMIIAEQVTGKRMAELHRDLIFEPLGLRTTWHPDDHPPLHAPPAATPWLGDQPLGDRPAAMRSIGDLSGTAGDLLRFGRALFSGQVFDDPSTIDLMQQRFIRFGLPTSMAALRSPAWPIEYSLGMMRYAPSRLMAGGRRLPPLLGHTGSTASWLWYCPPLRLLLAGTVDQATQAPLPFRAIPTALGALSS